MRYLFAVLALISLSLSTVPATALPVSGISSEVIAHSGRTNKDGCHHDKKNGGYHCH